MRFNRHGTDRFPEVAGDFSDQLSIQVIGDAAERFVHIAWRDDIVRQRHGDIERRQGVVGRIIGYGVLESVIRDNIGISNLFCTSAIVIDRNPFNQCIGERVLDTAVVGISVFK